MAGAAGGFVTRAFESMLKESVGKKYATLQKALKAYLGIPLNLDFPMRVVSYVSETYLNQNRQARQTCKVAMDDRTVYSKIQLK